jgi:hypothetical protein
VIETPRLRLHRWDDRHREAFATMHADPEVMADYGGPINGSESSEKFERYVAAQRDHRVSRWAVENLDGAFLGYAGVMPRLSKDHPLGAHFELGSGLYAMLGGMATRLKAPRQRSDMLFMKLARVKSCHTQAGTTNDHRPSWLSSI